LKKAVGISAPKSVQIAAVLLRFAAQKGWWWKSTGWSDPPLKIPEPRAGFHQAGLILVKKSGCPGFLDFTSAQDRIIAKQAKTLLAQLKTVKAAVIAESS
jgi:hypothetical protein